LYMQSKIVPVLVQYASRHVPRAASGVLYKVNVLDVDEQNKLIAMIAGVHLTALVWRRCRFGSPVVCFFFPFFLFLFLGGGGRERCSPTSLFLSPVSYFPLRLNRYRPNKREWKVRGNRCLMLVE